MDLTNTSLLPFYAWVVSYIFDYYTPKRECFFLGDTHVK